MIIRDGTIKSTFTSAGIPLGVCRIRRVWGNKLKSKNKHPVTSLPARHLYYLLGLISVSGCGGEKILTAKEVAALDLSDSDNRSSSPDFVREVKRFDYSEYLYNDVGAEIKAVKFHAFDPIFNDFNQDGDLDIFLPLMRGQISGGVGLIVNEPAENFQIVLDFSEQENDIIINDELMLEGSLGGWSRRHAVGDLNGDGIDDFAFAMSMEDGRTGFPLENMLAPPAVLLSEVENTFSIEKLGQPDWGHSVEIVPNHLGYNDVLFGGYASNDYYLKGLQAYRMVEGEWIDVRDFYPVDPELGWANSIRHLEVGQGEGSRSFLAVSSRIDTGENGFYEVLKEGIKFFEWNIENGWVFLSEFWLESLLTIDFIAWNGDPATVPVMNYLGNQLIYPNFHEIRGASDLDGRDYFIVRLSGMRLKEGETLQDGFTYREDGAQFEAMNSLIFFEVGHSGQISMVKSPIIDEVTNINFDYYIEDVNNDGRKDIVVSAASRPGFDELSDSGGHPIIYLSDVDGNFHQRDISHLPKHSSYEDGHGYELFGWVKDIDQDGYHDLILSGRDEAAVEIIFLNEYL